jgi:hypothetical protein
MKSQGPRSRCSAYSHITVLNKPPNQKQSKRVQFHGIQEMEGKQHKHAARIMITPYLEVQQSLPPYQAGE